MLKKLYNSFAGRCLLKVLTSPVVSKAAGAFMNSTFSKPLIKPFIKKNNIDMSDYKVENWHCFNEFFTRKLRPGKRPVDQRELTLVSPCDGYLTVYNLSPGASFEIKNTVYTAADLLQNRSLADEYQGGQCLVFRLTPSDYHRYIYPDKGCKGKNIHIPGVLHTVRPIAFEKYPVFTANAREYTILRTNNFDDMVYMEVGAMMVGKIHNYHQECNFDRGDEKGMFLFGGSTIIILIKKDVAIIDSEIKECSNMGKEFKVRLGESIGIRI